MSRGIATFPALILRWQNEGLGLDDGPTLTLAHFLSYYLKRNKWPSVSINAMAKARGVNRAVVEGEIAQLEAMGYVAKAGTDSHYGTFYYDCSGLLVRLEFLAGVEEQEAALKKEQRRLRRAARLGGRGDPEAKTEDEIENSTQRTTTLKEPKETTAEETQVEGEKPEAAPSTRQPRRRSLASAITEESSGFHTAADGREAAERMSP